MAEYINHLLFGVYPYVAIGIMVIGSIMRYDRDQYTWKTSSSQLLADDGMRIGNNLFHVGILLILVGHAVGLLTPTAVQESDRFGIVIGGQRSINSNLALDGADFNDPLVGNQRGGKSRRGSRLIR